MWHTVNKTAIAMLVRLYKMLYNISGDFHLKLCNKKHQELEKNLSLFYGKIMSCQPCAISVLSSVMELENVAAYCFSSIIILLPFFPNPHIFLLKKLNSNIFYGSEYISHYLSNKLLEKLLCYFT